MKRKKSRKSSREAGPAFVEIRIDANGDAFIDDCGVSKALGDEVQWVSDFGPWLIHFPRPAFAAQDFAIGPGGGATPWSGPALGTRGRYPYTIRGLKMKKDPNIIIK